jgi:hypothetical protein
MKIILVTIIAVGCCITVLGCGPSTPDEATLHKELGGPPKRPKSRGVGQAKMDAAAGATTPAATGN